MIQAEVTIIEISTDPMVPKARKELVTFFIDEERIKEVKQDGWLTLNDKRYRVESVKRNFAITTGLHPEDPAKTNIRLLSLGPKITIYVEAR